MVDSFHQSAEFQQLPQETEEIASAASFIDSITNSSNSPSYSDCRNRRRDEFLRATLRIFLVVSPPLGRLQGRSRSLTHMDALEGETVFRNPNVAPKNTPAESPRLIISPPLQARRQKLARSQVSSSEYFSVTFDVGNNNDPDEFVVAAKGTSLAEALNGVCSRRGINLHNLNVYLDAYKTPLPILTTDTSWLGGKHVLIKGKDDSNRNHLSAKNSLKSTNSFGGTVRRKSRSYRSRSSRFFSASSDESTNPNEIQEKISQKSTKQRWSALFGNSKDSKMEQLVEQLNYYSRHGIPQLQAVDEDFEEALYNLEDTWKDIVRESTGAELNEREQQQQIAIWELVETEVTYIHTLRVLTDLFLSCLCNLQSKNILTEIENCKLFSNILEIYSANRYFWCQHLLPMLAVSRETGKLLNPVIPSDGFLKFEEIFHSYTTYCAEQTECQKYCRAKHAENELFTTYLVWCETQKDCNRLRLIDILVKPMQRITKYSLLLKAIQKNTEDQHHKSLLNEMIYKVDTFVRGINATLRHRQDLERLSSLISKIEAYDVVETKDEDLDRILKNYNKFDLTYPMPNCCNSQKRFFIMESDLKLKEISGTKVDVHCILLTDMLLICKMTASSKRTDPKFRIFKPPFIIERLVIHEMLKDPAALAVIYLTEFKVPSTAFLLSSADQKLLKSWASNIKKAQNMYCTAKQATSTSNLHLSLNRQPSSLFEDELTDTGEDGLLSTGLYPARSPRGSSKGSSPNHSHNGSVEINDAGSSVSSRGVSVENEQLALRGSSQSSDEVIFYSAADKFHHRHMTLFGRRKCVSPNTLNVQVPSFSNLGQSLPNLSQMSSNSTSPNPPSSMTLLAPPKGTPPRGISYPPPSPPLRRVPAVIFSRNPPLLKTRHLSSSTTASSIAAFISHDNICSNDPPATTQLPPKYLPVVSDHNSSTIIDHLQESQNLSQSQPRCGLIQRLTRMDNKRCLTTGIIDDIKKQDFRDSRIYKRLSWNCGHRSKSQTHASNNFNYGHDIKMAPTYSNSSSCSCDSSSTGLTDSRSFNESIQDVQGDNVFTEPPNISGVTSSYFQDSPPAFNIVPDTPISIPSDILTENIFTAPNIASPGTNQSIVDNQITSPPDKEQLFPAQRPISDLSGENQK